MLHEDVKFGDPARVSADRIEFLELYSMVKATHVLRVHRSFDQPKSLPADPRPVVGTDLPLFCKEVNCLRVNCIGLVTMDVVTSILNGF